MAGQATLTFLRFLTRHLCCIQATHVAGLALQPATPGSPAASAAKARGCAHAVNTSTTAATVLKTELLVLGLSSVSSCQPPALLQCCPSQDPAAHVGTASSVPMDASLPPTADTTCSGAWLTRNLCHCNKCLALVPATAVSNSQPPDTDTGGLLPGPGSNSRSSRCTCIQKRGWAKIAEHMAWVGSCVAPASTSCSKASSFLYKGNLVRATHANQQCQRSMSAGWLQLG
jgi:hypothetical protein